MNKIVKVTNCNGMLPFVKAIKDNTNKPLRECKCIVDSLIVPTFGKGMKSVGTLLLNESSITPEQWEAIVKQCDETNVGLKWEYV